MGTMDIERAREIMEMAKEARNVIWEAEAREKAEAARPFVGRAFRYRNSYGGDEGWWLYALAISTGGATIHIIEVEEDCYGRLEIKEDTWHERPLDGYREIPLTEFHEQYLRGIKKLDGLMDAAPKDNKRAEGQAASPEG